MTGNDRRNLRDTQPNAREMSKSASQYGRYEAPPRQAARAVGSYSASERAEGEYLSRRAVREQYVDDARAGEYRQHAESYARDPYSDEDAYARRSHTSSDSGADGYARDRYYGGQSADAQHERADVPDWVVSATQAFRQRPSAPPPAGYMHGDARDLDYARSDDSVPPREPVRAAISVAESTAGARASASGNPPASQAHISASESAPASHTYPSVSDVTGAEHSAARRSARRAVSASPYGQTASQAASQAHEARNTPASDNGDADLSWSERRRERKRQRTERKSMKRALRRLPVGGIPAGREGADAGNAPAAQSGNARAANTHAMSSASIRAASNAGAAASTHAPDASRAAQPGSPQPADIQASSSPSSSADEQTQPKLSRRQRRKARKRQRRADKRARRAARKGAAAQPEQTSGETSSSAKPRKRRWPRRLMILAALLAAMIMLSLNEPALTYTPLGPLASASYNMLSLVVDGCYHIQYAMSNMFTRDYDYDYDDEPARESNFPLTLLVNYWNPLPDDLSPALVNIGDGRQVDARCADDLDAMLDACRKAGHDPVICSAYRSHSYQTGLYENKVKRLRNEGMSEDDARKEAMTVVAYPGTSEHQTGLALDIVDASYQELDEEQENTDVQKWLMKNSYRYGFILRYPTGKSRITGIIYEPWHYRYVGRDVAREVYESGLCFEEYLQQR